MATPLINGVQHAFASIKINMLGRTLTGFVAVNYDDNVNIENNYGGGQFPDHQGVGNYEAKATLELYQYEMVALQQAANGARVQQIPPFDVNITYLATGSTQTVHDVIKNCRIKTNSRSLSQGDAKSMVTLELLCSHIDWHGQIPGTGATI